jgi:ubiquinone/menaquinone biosynthesis C-methylase UbiE
MKLYNFFKNKVTIQNILLLLIVIYIILYIRYDIQNMQTMQTMEGFETNLDNTDFKENNENNEIYDEFYSKIYDQLFYSENKNIFEVDNIIKYTKPNNDSFILDVGSGTGSHVYEFNKKKLNIMGVDKSHEMIKYSKNKFPDLSLRNGDVLTTMLFEEQTFTHILCLYFTIYEISNKRQLLSNCYSWLKPGGFLVLHLVNRSMFDPIIPPSNPVMFVNPQKYAKKRMTNSVVKFKKFDYDATYNEEKSNKSIFKETFLTKNSNKPIRVNNHHLYMDSQKEILGMAKDAGFMLKGKSAMTSCTYEYQYLYYLQKPF